MHCSCSAGLNDLYEASQKSLDSEMKLRQQLEQEIQLMRGLKEEKEVNTMSNLLLFLLFCYLCQLLHLFIIFFLHPLTRLPFNC